MQTETKGKTPLDRFPLVNPRRILEHPEARLAISNLLRKMEEPPTAFSDVKIFNAAKFITVIRLIEAEKDFFYFLMPSEFERTCATLRTFAAKMIIEALPEEQANRIIDELMGAK